MSDHLPECHLSTNCVHDYYNEPPMQCANCGESCICDRLRACEARVRYSNALSNAAAKREGHAEALDAARDAVAALPCWGAAEQGHNEQALAAIDALRGES